MVVEYLSHLGADLLTTSGPCLARPSSKRRAIEDPLPGARMAEADSGVRLRLLAMKFVHAADIHLDSPLAGLLARDDLPASVIRHCTRRAFAAMIDLALEEDVAFVVIAGDLYDGDWKDFSTGLFFAEQMRRLGRPCFLLRGNHDARSLITRNLKLPDNVREFSSRTCETFQLPDIGVALHGHSFPNRAVPEDLSASYRDRVEGMVNVGVLHTSADDPGEHESYAPCSTASLTLKNYDGCGVTHRAHRDTRPCGHRTC